MHPLKRENRPKARGAAAPPSFACEMSVPCPTEAEAEAILAELRRTIDPETKKPFEAENSRADPAYIRAALAVRRCHPRAQKKNGEPNYSGAARMCIDPGQLRSNSAGGLVQGWVTKLKRFEHFRNQASLATELGQMCPEELLSFGAPTEGPPSSFNIASPPMTATSEHESDGQAKVKIESDGQSPTPAPTAAPLTGKRVLIKGVVARPELNGTHGTALKWLGDERGRYGVRLGDDTEVALKPVNLEEAKDQSVDEDLESDGESLRSLLEWCEKHSQLHQDQGPVGSDEENPLVARITQGMRSVSTNEIGALVTIHDGGPAARVGRIVAPTDDEHYEVTVGASNETVHISQLSELYYETPSSLSFTTELGEFHDDVPVAWTASSSDAARLEMLRESHTPCLGLKIDGAGIWVAYSTREIGENNTLAYNTLADLDCPSTEYVRVQMVLLGRDRRIQDEFSQDHLGEPFLVKRELYEVNIAEPLWADFEASSNRRISLNVGEFVGVRTRLQIEAMLGTGRGTEVLRYSVPRPAS